MEIRRNCQDEEMQIIDYRSATDVDIKFLYTGRILKNQSYSNFKSGALIDYSLPTVFGKGILGDYANTNKRISDRQDYRCWSDMLKRCYHHQDLQKYPTYSRCSVCEEWLRFEQYVKWHQPNYYKCGSETMCLDKDILIKNNSVYSPETAIFVPERINILFTKTNKTRGEFPIGVYYKKKSNKFCAQVSIVDQNSGKKQQQYLGLFDTPEEAFFAYKASKENYIKEIADQYKSKYETFPQKLYDALYQYKVEITD